MSLLAKVWYIIYNKCLSLSYLQRVRCRDREVGLLKNINMKTTRKWVWERVSKETKKRVQHSNWKIAATKVGHIIQSST